MTDLPIEAIVPRLRAVLADRTSAVLQAPPGAGRPPACRWQYFAVKKDPKGRYPKHCWPDDPLQATATSRVRPRP